MRQQIYIEVLTWEDYLMSHLEIFSPLSPEVAWTTAVTWTRWGHTGWWCWSRSTASGAARVWCTWCRCRSRGNTRTTSGFSPRVLLYRQKPSMIDKTLCTSGTKLAPSRNQHFDVAQLISPPNFGTTCIRSYSAQSVLNSIP